jgi:hypothetical protein
LCNSIKIWCSNQALLSMSFYAANIDTGSRL